jgi:hypothetical protein
MSSLVATPRQRAPEFADIGASRISTARIHQTEMIQLTGARASNVLDPRRYLLTTMQSC